MIHPNLASWFSGCGEEHTFSQVYEEILKCSRQNEIHVGTDSDPNGRKYAFVTGVVIRYPGAGGNYFWTRRYIPAKKFYSLGQRLEKEVFDSLIVADMLREKTGIDSIVIHVDCSNNPDHASARFLAEITSFAKGMGFKVVSKPESWAASSVADKHAKAY